MSTHPRRLILAAATDLFARRGYAMVGVDDIAAAVGTTGPTFYRHYPSKYDVLQHLSIDTAARLARAAGRVDPSAPLEVAVGALVRSAVSVRRGVGSLRRDRAHLRECDRAAVERDLGAVAEVVRRVVQASRPDLTGRSHDAVVTAVLALVSSVGDHRTALSTRAIATLLGEAAAATVAAAGPGAAPVAADRGIGVSPAGKREALLDGAAALFAARGFHPVTMADIGSVAELAPSTVYRYHRSKSDVLTEVCLRAAQRAAERTADVLAASVDHRGALTGLVHAEIAAVRTNPGLRVLHLERDNVADPVRRTLSDLLTQERTEWTHVVRSIRIALHPAEAKYLVAAARTQIFDLARVSDATPASMVLATLLGPAAG